METQTKMKSKHALSFFVNNLNQKHIRMLYAALILKQSL